MLVQGSVAMVSFKNIIKYSVTIMQVSLLVRLQIKHHNKKILFMWHKLDHTRSVAPLWKTLEQVPENSSTKEFYLVLGWLY